MTKVNTLLIRKKNARRQVVWTGFLYILFLCGCTTTQTQFSVVEPPLEDHLFPNYQNVEIPTSDEIFAASEEMRTFLAAKVSNSGSDLKRFQQLADEILFGSENRMSYSNDANYSASQSFQEREANCLSLTIMTYALARELAIPVELQRVDTPAYWQVFGGYGINNTHINLRLVDAPSPRWDLYARGTYITGEVYEIDFSPQISQHPFDRWVISVEDVTAIFYNNRAAVEMLTGEPEKAYAYLKAALTINPSDADSWVNLGVLYRSQGHADLALQSYEYALKLDNHHTSAINNYVLLMESLGLYGEVATLKNEMLGQRNKNPYYQAYLADQQLEAGNYEAAIELYRKAIRMNPDVHEFHFGLSKSHYMLGDLAQSARVMQRAKRTASFEDDRKTYDGKLQALSSLIAQKI